jgi:hypothetical protein
MVPIDDKRRHQRGYERQDDRDCQSEQRRLHGASELSLNPRIANLARLSRKPK